MNDANNKKQIPFAIVAIAVLSLMCSVAQAEATAKRYEEVIELFIGQTDILSYRGVSRVSLGNGELADVKVLEDTAQILMIAKKTGVTDLRVWLKDGRQFSYLVRILSQPTEDILGQVQAHLSDIEGVQARLAGDKVIIEGQSLREEDTKRVQAVADQFASVANYVTPGGITLRGMIHLDVKVVEVRKNSLRRIGIDWSELTSGPTFGYLSDIATNDVFRGTLAPTPPELGAVLPSTLDAGSNNGFFGISSRIDSVINFLEQNGDARLLAEPKLTCRSGGEAEFLVGGEVPIPVTNLDGAIVVTFKQFGIILNMSPVSDPQGYISTRLEVEVSAIDRSLTVLGVPGFATRRTETDMNVKQGQTMVISGLFSSERSKDVDKVPGLGHVPVLGELFKSRQFRNNETDLVVFVTPSIVNSEHKINKDMLQHAADIQERADHDLRFHLKD